MSIHDAHRQRMREQIRQKGLDGFTEIQVLELLLFYTIPRADTNETAHRLLDRFGSFVNVLQASERELREVEGVGEQSAFFLSLLPQVLRFYQIRESGDMKRARSTDEYISYLIPYFAELHDETVYLLCLDAKGKILGCEKIGVGTVNSANAPLRRIMEAAIRLNASMAVLAHNHPSGLAVPSKEDVQVTEFVASMLKSIDVVLADHIIVASGDAVSLYESRYYDPHAFLA